MEIGNNSSNNNNDATIHLTTTTDTTYENTLVVKHLPDALDEADVKELFEHYGATRVRCMPKHGKMKGWAFVTFADAESAYAAYKKFNNLTMDSKSTLVVEYARNPNEKKKDDDREKRQQPRDDGDPIAPQLGFYYCSNPNLVYLYPAPTPSIIANIANTLIAVPKFYTQVLHLMNKMNLPPPFGAPLPVPPMPAAAESRAKRKRAEAEEIEEEEEEDESDISESESEISAEEEQKTKKPRRREQAKKTEVRHVQVTKTTAATTATTAPKLPTMTFKLAPTTAKALEKEAAAAAAATTTASSTMNTTTTSTATTTTTTATTTATTASHYGPRQRTIISLEELNAHKASPEYLAAKFPNYSEGEPTNKLYIKNLAHKVVEVKDLERIYGRYFATDEEMREKLDINLMKEGRLKGQAFVTFPSVELAQQALRETHGFMLHDKPMIVQFGRSK